MAIRVSGEAFSAVLLPGTATRDVLVAEFLSNIGRIPAMLRAAGPRSYATLAVAALNFGGGGAPLARRASDHAAISRRRALPAYSHALPG